MVRGTRLILVSYDSGRRPRVRRLTSVPLHGPIGSTVGSVGLVGNADNRGQGASHLSTYRPLRAGGVGSSGRVTARSRVRMWRDCDGSGVHEKE